MNSILLNRKNCNRILSGKHKVIILKWLPKHEQELRIYLYQRAKESKGAVVGECYCKEIIRIEPKQIDTPMGNKMIYDIDESLLHKHNLSFKKLAQYGLGDTIYLLVISDVIKYKTQKTIDDFNIVCRVSCRNCKDPQYFDDGCQECGNRRMKKAPSTYAYVICTSNDIWRED